MAAQREPLLRDAARRLCGQRSGWLLPGPAIHLGRRPRLPALATGAALCGVRWRCSRTGRSRTTRAIAPLVAQARKALTQQMRQVFLKQWLHHHGSELLATSTPTSNGMHYYHWGGLAGPSACWRQGFITGRDGRQRGQAWPGRRVGSSSSLVCVCVVAGLSAVQVR